MKKPARAKLTARVQAAAKSIPGTTCYGHGGTEILFSEAAALIVHQGVDGQTVGDIADNVDALLGEGAFAQLRATGTFMVSDETTLDEPSQLYSLSVDPVLMGKLDSARVVADPVAEPVEAEAEIVAEALGAPIVEAPVVEAPVVEAIATDDGFTEDKVFSQTGEDEVAIGASETAPVVDMPKGDKVDIDLTAGEVVFSTTKLGDACAKIVMPGQRTTMAFGPVAEALRGKDAVICIVTAGRSTDKIVAVYGDNDEVVIELPRAA